MQISNFYDFYINKLGTSVMLTSAREKELSIIIQANKDQKKVAMAVEEFVLANLKLVVSEAFSYSKKCGSYMQEAGFELGDLVSAGHIGLMKAIYKYDSSYNTKFSTYAIPWIRQPIRRFIYQSSPITIPPYIMNDAIKHRKLEEENENISDSELMEILQLSEKGLLNVKLAKHSKVSLDAPFNNGNGDNDNNGGILDVLPDHNAENPSDKFEQGDKIRIMMEALNELDEMRKEIVMSQCFSDDKVNLSVLGKKWKLTGERIRQIKEESLKMIKSKMKKKGIDIENEIID